MKHYSASDWLAFKNGSIKPAMAENMEIHLLDCDQCMYLFLELTSKPELARVNTCIPSDFSRTTLAHIKSQQIPQPRNMGSRDKIKQLLSYYVVAAAFTLMLVSSGVFQAAVGEAAWAPDFAARSAAKSDNIIFAWPTRLIETSSSWTQLIPKESKTIEEVIWR